MVTMMTKEGTKRAMKFTACDVSKAIGSVSQMCRSGHKVVFNPPWDQDGSYTEHIDTGERMWLEEQGDCTCWRPRWPRSTNRRVP